MAKKAKASDVTGERLTGTGRYLADIGIRLIAEAEGANGAREKADLMESGRGFIRDAIKADKAAETAEVAEIKALLEDRSNAAQDGERIQ